MEKKQGMKIELQVNHYSETNNYDYEIWVLIPEKPPVIFESEKAYSTEEQAKEEGEAHMAKLTSEIATKFFSKIHALEGQESSTKE